MDPEKMDRDPFIDYESPAASLASLGFKSKNKWLSRMTVFRFLAISALLSFLICGGLSVFLTRPEPAPEAGKQRISVQVKGKDRPEEYIYGPVRLPATESQGWKPGRFDLQNAINGATLGLLIAGFWLGLRQREAEEKAKSFEAAFARKTRSNDYLLSKPELQKYADAATEVEIDGTRILFDDVMYGYLELDNLEFVYEHFRDSLIKPKAALRAVSIFRSRCDNPGFASLVKVLCEKGEYRPQFVDAVKLVLKVRRASDVEAVDPADPDGPSDAAI